MMLRWLHAGCAHSHRQQAAHMRPAAPAPALSSSHAQTTPTLYQSQQSLKPSPLTQVLFEDEQILPDGRSRRRNVTVSEKLIGGPGCCTGVRGLQLIV